MGVFISGFPDTTRGSAPVCVCHAVVARLQQRLIGHACEITGGRPSAQSPRENGGRFGETLAMQCTRRFAEWRATRTGRAR